MPALSYLPGDKVWLNARNLCTNSPSCKLNNHHHGPFTVIKEVGKYTYQLDLPATMDVHPVFHISLLRPTQGDQLPGQHLPLPEPIVVDGESEYEVEEVVDSRIFRWQLQYLIK
jgi:hypothetical protein